MIRKIYVPALLFLLLINICAIQAMDVWVVGDAEKIRPGTASPVSGTSNLDVSNYVWNKALRQVTIAGAKNEFVAFQVVIENENTDLTGVSLHPTDLTGGSGNILLSSNYEFFIEYYIHKGENRTPDPLISTKLMPDYATFDIPDSRIHNFSNKCQAVWVDLYIPHNAAAGDYQGKIAVFSDQQGVFEINIQLQVYDFTLPDKCNYDFEFNHYGSMASNWPGGTPPSAEAFLEFERNSYRLLHKNRVRLNRVPYTQGGNPSSWLKEGMWPVLEGEGENIHVKDWSAWDERFGPYLSGSAFADLPRSSAPVDHWMLPFNHRFPSEFNDYWHGDTLDFPYIGTMPAYDAENIAIMKEFEEHLNEKGWTEPLYHIFYNEKGRGKFSNQLSWYLDEPVNQRDFEAIRFYSELFHEGFTNTIRSIEELGDAQVELSGFPEPSDARFVFRLDFGRQTLNNHYLDGYVDLWNIGGGPGEGRYYLSEVQERVAKGEMDMYYGPWAYALDGYNLDLIWSAWNNWRRRATGLELWDTMGWSNDMTSNWDAVVSTYYSGLTTYMYPGYRLGLNTPLPTLRMKQIRRGVQDWEYLYRLKELTGSDNASDQVVSELMGMDEESFSSNRSTYNLTEKSFADARATLAGLIMAAGGTPQTGIKGDYNGDGKLSINDAIMLARLLVDESGNIDYDYNGDGRFAITDVISLILHMMNSLSGL